MLRGLYTAGYTMKTGMSKMDIVSNNLANVSTTGYKRDGLNYKSFPEVLAIRLNDTQSPSVPGNEVGNMSLGSDVGQIFTYYSQGVLNNAGNDNDLAISDDGKGFFSVEVTNDNGDVSTMYTRDGSFTLGSDGYLVTQTGNRVMGSDGPIVVPAGQKMLIGTDGSITVNGEPYGKLKMVSFSDTSVLRKVGSNLVRVEGDTEPEDFKGEVLQGFLEGSNVNSVTEMVEMISVMRNYESGSKVLKAYDDTLDKTVNDIGRLG